MTTTTRLDNYVMGRTAEETERLRQQSALLDGPTSALLDRANLVPGDTCLDVGCGPGEVMRQMSRRVGARGRVTGVDLDADVAGPAVAALDAEGPAACEFVPGDIAAGELPDGRHALVFARLLLLHLQDPVAALRAMWERTAPGGTLAILDFDFRTVTTADGHPLAEIGRVCRAVFSGAGLDPYFGATVPDCFARAGIGDPDGAEMGAMFGPMSEIASYVAASYRSMLPAALKLDATDEARAAAFLADIEAREGRDREYALGPLIVTAWRRKA